MPEPGRPDLLGEGLARVTAPNPGMMTGPGTNTYLVGGSELAVIDPGPELPVHRDAIVATAAAGSAPIRWILVTHTHPDHAPGAARLAEATGATVVGFDRRDGFVPEVVARDGWRLVGPGFTLRAVHTPGHASNHLCWLLEERGILLSGDHVMHGSTVVIRPPDGDMAVYLRSLQRLLDLGSELRAIAPGHGRIISDPHATVSAIVAHRLQREEVVAEALVRGGPATVDQMVGRVYADVRPELFKVARFSLWAHLRKLAEDGRALGRPVPGGSLDGAAGGDATPGPGAPGADGPMPTPDHPELSWVWRAA